MGVPIETKIWRAIVGPPAKKGRRKGKKKASAAAHPLVAVRKLAAGINGWRADGLESGRVAKEKSAAATLKRNQEKAKKRARKAAGRKDRDARIAAAQVRRAKQARPTVRTAPQVVTQRRATPTEVNASLCNSTDTDDHQPCQNKTTGGPCSAGHTRARPRTRATANA